VSVVVVEPGETGLAPGTPLAYRRFAELNEVLALHMGAPPYRRKLEQATRVVAELDRRGAKADSFMLDNEARPDRVVVRMR
jgi:hypothetical protein